MIDVDMSMTETGEPEISGGDFKLAYGSYSILNSVLFRLKTIRGDFSLMPECGASLEGVIGEPNNEETGALIESLVMESLTHDNYLSPENIDIEVFPYDHNTIVILLYITYQGEEIRLVGNLDLREGQLNISAP